MDTYSFPVHLEKSLVAVSAPSLYFFLFVFRHLSLSVSFSPFIRKMVCESCIKGSHVSYSNEMGHEIQMNRTQKEEERNEMWRWEVANEKK